MAHLKRARDHHDMLNICCGICGFKKQPSKLRKITDGVLTQIKAVPDYAEYDLIDPRYPKVICNEHY